MPNLEVTLPSAVAAALQSEAKRTGQSTSSIVTEALARQLNVSIHTLFQVSLTGALVAGVYDREVSVEYILRHGDFGLGTFTGLDGEMVVLDGKAYYIPGSGRIVEAVPSCGTPFAVVTRFAPDIDTQTGAITGFDDFAKQCDQHRKSGNIFYALRLDGHFNSVRTRSMNPPRPGTRLVDAAKDQSEFYIHDVDGTLVGIWSPGFSSAFSVAGYHFHFLSNDRLHGGHLLDLDASPLRLRIEPLTNFHLALPESEAYLKADLSKNTDDELAYAERAH